MPSREQTSLSAYERLRRQAANALSTLRKQIEQTESELDTLRKQQQLLESIAGEKPARAATASNGAPPAGRTNWRTVLTKLPKRFKAADVHKVRGLGQKRSGEIFAAVTRWIDGGLVKRKERGVYERVE